LPPKCRSRVLFHPLLVGPATGRLCVLFLTFPRDVRVFTWMVRGPHFVAWGDRPNFFVSQNPDLIVLFFRSSPQHFFVGATDTPPPPPQSVSVLKRKPGRLRSLGFGDFPFPVLGLCSLPFLCMSPFLFPWRGGKPGFPPFRGHFFSPPRLPCLFLQGWVLQGFSLVCKPIFFFLLFYRRVTWFRGLNVLLRPWNLPISREKKPKFYLQPLFLHFFLFFCPSRPKTQWNVFPPPPPHLLKTAPPLPLSPPLAV